MQLDPAMLQRVLSMNDGDLWKTVAMIASQNGLDLPQKTPAAEEMQKLRRALASVTDQDMADAARLVQEFKNGAKKK